MRFLAQFEVDRHSGEPLALQIVRRIEDAATSGRLPYGTKLPSIRDLASNLGVSCSCAAHAYEVLSARGITHSRPGSGYFVAVKPHLSFELSGHGRQAEVAQKHQVQANIFADSSENQIEFDFALEGIAPLLCNWAEIGSSFRHVLQNLHSPQKHPSEVRQLEVGLRRMICLELETRGLFGLEREELLLFNNERQALTFLINYFAQDSDSVIAIEEPASIAIRDAVLAHTSSIVFIPRQESLSDEEWAVICEQRLSEARPKLLIASPNFHDPTGHVMSPFVRNRLIALAAKHNFQIIEWDPFATLGFGEVFQTPLSALDGLTRSIYVTKVGVEFGEKFALTVICSRPPLAAQLKRAKMTTYGASSTLEEGLLADLWSRGLHRKQVHRLARTLLQKRDHLLGMLTRLAPGGCEWNQPLGGFFLWFAFPDGIDSEILNRKLEAKGFRIAPGKLFGHDPALSRFMRLNFSYFDPEISYRALKALFAQVNERERHESL